MDRWAILFFKPCTTIIYFVEITDVLVLVTVDVCIITVAAELLEVRALVPVMFLPITFAMDDALSLVAVMVLDVFFTSDDALVLVTAITCCKTVACDVVTDRGRVLADTWPNVDRVESVDVLIRVAVMVWKYVVAAEYTAFHSIASTSPVVLLPGDPPDLTTTNSHSTREPSAVPNSEASQVAVIN